MAVLLYRLGIGLYHLGIRLAALFNPKARQWVQGRAGWREALHNWRANVPAQAKVVWMHCASLGEFEQGRPVLEQLRQRYPDLQVVLSFYSPSGYEQRKNYSGADYVCYLPADSPANSQRWLSELQPDLIVFVKYEFWYFHLKAAFQRNIPTYIIAASFRADQIFFRWYGQLFRQLLQSFAHLYVQTAKDADLLSTLDLKQVTVAGDPRVDQVLSIASADYHFPLIAQFAAQHKVFIAGSSWPPGEEILLADQQLWAGDWKLLIAPHDISAGHVQQIIDRLELRWVRYSSAPSPEDLQQARVLILDTIGMLSRVYRYGDLAYIGGGFGRSIHNTLEPAAHGLPVLFGPRHEKFSEAITLLQRGGAFLIESTEEFQQVFAHLSLPENHRQAAAVIQSYLQENQGAASLIAEELGAALRLE